MANGTMDTPDRTVRTALWKQANGYKLSDKETRRLMNRQHLESQMRASGGNVSDAITQPMLNPFQVGQRDREQAQQYAAGFSGHSMPQSTAPTPAQSTPVAPATSSAPLTPTTTTTPKAPATPTAPLTPTAPVTPTAGSSTMGTPVANLTPRQDVIDRINAGLFDPSKLQWAGGGRGLTSAERAAGNKVGPEAEKSLRDMPDGTGIAGLSSGQFQAFGRDGKSQEFGTRGDAVKWLNSQVFNPPAAPATSGGDGSAARARLDAMPPMAPTAKPYSQTFEDYGATGVIARGAKDTAMALPSMINNVGQSVAKANRTLFGQGVYEAMGIPNRILFGNGQNMFTATPGNGGFLNPANTPKMKYSGKLPTIEQVMQQGGADSQPQMSPIRQYLESQFPQQPMANQFMSPMAHFNQTQRRITHAPQQARVTNSMFINNLRRPRSMVE